MARLVARESRQAVDRFEAALKDGRLGAAPTLAALQDALALDSPRAQAFRRVLLAATGLSTAQILDSIGIARAAVIEVQALNPPVEVALTHPGPVQPLARTTGAVAREVIQRAQRSLLVVGYSVTVDAELTGLAARTIQEMAEAARRGVLVTAILHRNPANRNALLSGWPAGRQPPRLFTWPERDRDEMASLHAKVLVSDSDQALVTSANLTYHGFEANVEVGVRVSGHPARQLESIFHELIRVHDFVPWPE